MANTKSAKKAIRVAARKAKQNQLHRDRYKKAVKDVMTAVENKDKKGLDEKVSKAYKEIDKAAKTRVLNKNTASRKKSRVGKLSAAVS